MVSFVEGESAGESSSRAATKQSSKMYSPRPIKTRASGVTVVTRQSGLGLKVKATGAADVPATSQLDGDLSEDPIAQSLSCRVRLGGFGTNATEADAKKNSYPVFKAEKLPALKGTALLDIGAPAKA